MAWADELPAMKARREAWQAKHGPALRAVEEQKLAERARLVDIITRGLNAIDATAEERALVFNRTGVAA